MTNVNLVILFLAFVAGFLMLWRIPAGKSSAQRDQSPPDADASRLSIIIPAYNEEKRLPPLLASLQSQHQRPLEILVVDDASTDRTASIAAAFAAAYADGGVRVIRSEDMGEGWVGKSRACWSGARQAHGDWLLFLDADTRLETHDSLGRLCAEYEAAGASGLLSWQPYHTASCAYESLSLPFNIIAMAGVNVFTPLGERLPPAGVFGPCLLCDRTSYDLAEGHRAVKGDVLEDLALGKRFLSLGLPVRCRPGKGILSFRMYPEGFKSLLEGWTKNFSTGSSRTHPLLLLLVLFWISGGFAVTSLLIESFFIRTDGPDGLGAVVAMAALWTLYLVQFAWLGRKVGDWKRWPILVYPLLHTFFAFVFIRSLICTRLLHCVSWRGRDIHV